MGSKTGEVIAMASVRINDEGVYEVTTGNYAAVDAYEPGSVGKVITVAGALNEGTVTPESTFLVPWRKKYTLRGDYLTDAAPHDEQWMNVQDILVKSSNIGTITISETMGFAKQYEYMRAFGFGERTALDFPDEIRRASSTRGSSGRAPRSTRSPTGRTSPAARSSWSPPSTRSPTTAATSIRSSSRASSTATAR